MNSPGSRPLGGREGGGGGGRGGRGGGGGRQRAKIGSRQRPFYKFKPLLKKKNHETIFVGQRLTAKNQRRDCGSDRKGLGGGEGGVGGCDSVN